MPALKNAISDAEAKRRGDLLRKMRDRFKLGQGDVAAMSGGHLLRSQVANAERGEILWTTDKQWSGPCAWLNVSRPQLEAWFAGEISDDQIYKLAKPRVEAWREANEAQEVRSDEVDSVAREVLSMAGLSEDEFGSDVLLPFLRATVRQRGTGASRRDLSNRAKLVRELIVETEREKVESLMQRARAHESHKSETPPPHRRR